MGCTGLLGFEGLIWDQMTCSPINDPHQSPSKPRSLTCTAERYQGLTEVGQLELAPLVNEQVLRLEVPVQNLPPVAVGQAPQNLEQEDLERRRHTRTKEMRRLRCGDSCHFKTCPKKPGTLLSADKPHGNRHKNNLHFSSPIVMKTHFHRAGPAHFECRCC